MESKIILYHSNEESRCTEFINNEHYLIVSKNSKDNIWLGTGMYFWDNMCNAKWWNQKQRLRDNAKQYNIVAVNAVLNNLLDLTDFDIYMKLEKMWKRIYKVLGLSHTMALGDKLDFLFDVLDFKNKYDLIKIYGKYNHTPNNGFFNFDFQSMNSEPTIAVKCIYNIRNEKCIIEKEIIKEV